MATFTVKQVAEKLGCSGKTIQRIIAEHPEMGVVMVARKPTLLDEKQVSQVADFFSKRSQGLDKSAPQETDSKSAKVRQTPPVSANGSQVSVDLLQVLGQMSQVQSSETVSKSEAELMAKVAKLEAERDAAEQRIRDREEEIARLIAEHDKERMEFSETKGLLSGLNDDLKHRLEDAETKAERALSEANSYKPSLFGFYRKKGIAAPEKRIEG